jgi:3-hydroxybutyryl-CoA dehydrogenase
LNTYVILLRREAMNIEKVCVVGLGTMGSQIAVVFGKAGLTTIVVETEKDQLDQGMGRIESFLAREIKKGKIGDEDKEAVLGKLVTHTDVSAGASEADFVVEAVFEDMDVKKQIFAELDQACGPDVILATNTSTLSITEIAAATKRPELCVGTHFLIPAALTPLVEMVRGLVTSDETVKITQELLKKCGKDAVVVADSPAFVINRLYVPLINDAFYTLAEGVASAEEIDKSCQRGLGMPLGPLKAAIHCTASSVTSTYRLHSWSSLFVPAVSGGRQARVFMSINWTVGPITESALIVAGTVTRPTLNRHTLSPGPYP